MKLNGSVNSFFFFFYLWWILSYIEMKQPWVYMCSPSRSPFPPPSPPAPSRSSQCTFLFFNSSSILDATLESFPVSQVSYHFHFRWSPSNSLIPDVRAIWLRHLSPHRWRGWIRRTWLARRRPLPPSPLHARPSRSCALGPTGRPPPIDEHRSSVKGMQVAALHC